MCGHRIDAPSEPVIINTPGSISHTDTLKHSFFPLAIEICNALPKEIVELNSADGFVAKLEPYSGCT